MTLWSKLQSGKQPQAAFHWTTPAAATAADLDLPPRTFRPQDFLLRKDLSLFCLILVRRLVGGGHVAAMFRFVTCGLADQPG